ncbi:MAG: hypothetical protein M1819_005983 [Sarea resinae]|nr:MAG: hypothetical protein M1819_005983 [Sarea resinae]
MSATGVSDPVQNPPGPGNKAKKNKKKKNAAKAKVNGEAAAVAEGTKPGDADADADEGEGDDLETMQKNAPSNGIPDETPNEGADTAEPNTSSNGKPNPDRAHHNVESQNTKDTSSSSNGSPVESKDATSSSETERKLEALAKDRDALRTEVAELRKALEGIQEKHRSEVSGLQEQIEEAQGEKDHAEAQYRNLLGKVNTIKSQLGERLKADAEELSQARTQIEELEDQNRSLKESNDSLDDEIKRLAEEDERRSKELSSLRNRTNLSQQNWSKERDDLIQREAFAKEEFEAAKQAMQDWEVLAMEERSIREHLAERFSDLEEQLSAQKEAYEKAAADRDSQNLTVDGLQRALQEIQEARKKELRELVESTQTQVEELQKELQVVQQKAAESDAALETTRKDLERALPFEKEVKEKNLLIGKLRHEAVILNDHLTKALRYLKKGKPEDNIDRQIVTNHFLHFLALDRADPKKFEVLQLIAALLNWTEEQREQAGLARPGGLNANHRVPLSPFHRTPSTPVFSAELFPDSGNNKESLADLWSNFLRQEAQEGSKGSRSASSSSSQKPPLS